MSNAAPLPPSPTVRSGTPSWVRADGGHNHCSNIIQDSGTGRQKTGVRIGAQAGEVVLEDNTVKAANELLDERRKP